MILLTREGECPLTHRGNHLKFNKRRLLIISVFAIFILALLALGFTNQNKARFDDEMLQSALPIESPVLSDVETQTSKSDVSIQVASDIHHLSPSLRNENAVFQTFLDSGDGKLLAYSTEILEAMRDMMQIGSSDVPLAPEATQAPDVLLITGDLTTNGELETHLWLKKYFESIEAMGTEVFVIPGNHDINNPYATDFSSGSQRRVDTVSADAFQKIYRDFGYEQAFSRDPASLSYAVRLTDSLYVLMLDTAKYEDNFTLGYPVMEGALRPETLTWISEVREQIKAESAGNANIITASHHNMIAHSPVHSEGFVVDNATESVEVLNALGTTLNFSGHIHIQDIVEDEAAHFKDIATGSLLQYPQTFGVLNITESSNVSSSSSALTSLTYETHWVDVEAYAKRMEIKNPDLLHFKSYAEATFKAQSSAMIGDRLDEMYTTTEIQAMSEVLAELNSRYFAGMDSQDKETILTSEGYKLWNDSELGFFKLYVQSMLLDEADDNYLYLELN